MNANRAIALVTGATGGIGAACAAHLGRAYRLFLADIDADRLDSLAADLAADGIEVAGCHAADLGADGAPARLVEAARAIGPLSAVVHAAGLSPAQADAAVIMRLNTRATAALLDAIEAALEPALAVVLIGSIGGHFAAPDGAIDALCADPSAPDFIDRIVPLMTAAGGDPQGREAAAAAYSYSKRANILATQRRCPHWAATRARIVSISPGLVDTAMGRAEVATDPGAASMLELTPLGWIAPRQIAATAAFLVSDAADALSGCDIRVDGGALAAFFQGRSTTGACVA